MADSNRSLAAALRFRPEAMQLISGSSDQTKKVNPPRPKQSEESVPAEPMSDSGGTARRLKKKRRTESVSQQQQQPQLSQARVAITIRLTPNTADALRHRSLERKLRGEPLHSQQEIIETALGAWLKQNC